jgi:hypothetical protein
VTSSRTISISGVPGSSAPAVSCTPALLYIVPPGFCQDPLALNVGQQGACQYPPGVKPFTKAPPWEEF